MNSYPLEVTERYKIPFHKSFWENGYTTYAYVYIDAITDVNNLPSFLPDFSIFDTFFKDKTFSSCNDPQKVYNQYITTSTPIYICRKILDIKKGLLEDKPSLGLPESIVIVANKSRYVPLTNYNFKINNILCVGDEIIDGVKNDVLRVYNSLNELKKSIKGFMPYLESRSDEPQITLSDQVWMEEEIAKKRIQESDVEYRTLQELKDKAYLEQLSILKSLTDQLNFNKIKERELMRLIEDYNDLIKKRKDSDE